jgi:RNA polymerase sigma-70 factor, ECF subfamily
MPANNFLTYSRLLCYAMGRDMVRSRQPVIHSLGWRVTGPVDATAPSLRRPETPAPVVDSPAGPRGVLLAFRQRGCAEDMTRPPLSSAGPDHVALMRAIAQRQDRAAFADLFAYFGPRVKAWMMRAGSTPTAAEELAQEAMLAVWQKARLFDPARAGVSTWIFTIARNLRIDTLRRERHPSELMPDPAEEPEAPMQADRALVMAQQEVRIRSALSLLPPEQAEVIRKAFFEDKVHAEIEKELGIPLGTVKSRLRLAMTRLRAALGDLG